jgi:hypothetical protein
MEADAEHEQDHANISELPRHDGVGDKSRV